MNALLKSISEQAAEDLRNLIEEGADDILAAIHKMQEESQLQETKPKFSLGFKVTIDYDAATYDCDLSWSLKQSLSTSHQIDDPNQGKLPIEGKDEGTIRIVSPNGTDTGPVPMSTMKAALKVLKHKRGKK